MPAHSISWERKRMRLDKEIVRYTISRRLCAATPGLSCETRCRTTLMHSFLGGLSCDFCRTTLNHTHFSTETNILRWVLQLCSKSEMRKLTESDTSLGHTEMETRWDTRCIQNLKIPPFHFGFHYCRDCGKKRPGIALPPRQEESVSPQYISVELWRASITLKRNPKKKIRANVLSSHCIIHGRLLRFPEALTGTMPFLEQSMPLYSENTSRSVLHSSPSSEMPCSVLNVTSLYFCTSKASKLKYLLRRVTQTTQRTCATVLRPPSTWSVFVLLYFCTSKSY